MEKIEIKIYEIPLENIPFNKLPIVLNAKFAYCKFYNLGLIKGENYKDFNLLGVFNLFSDLNINSVDEIIKNDLLFGEVLSFPPPIRGQSKWKLVGKELINKSEINLPYFKYCSSNNKSSEIQNWFYLKDGNYAVFEGIKTQYEKIKHLEENNIYAENTIKLRIILELLKRELGRLGQRRSLDQWKDIAFTILRSEYIHRNDSDEVIHDGVNNLLDDILAMPIYSDIPKKIRGKLFE